MRQLRWNQWTSQAHLLVAATSETLCAVARAEVERISAEVAQAINTFDTTSELARINTTGAGTYLLTDPLTDILAAALEAHRLTNGAFDPRVPALGDNTGHPLTPSSGPTIELTSHGELLQTAEPIALHEQVKLKGNTLHLADGIALNLIALGKAHTVDAAARAAATATGAPTLVNIGGDIATAGPPYPWTITVQDLPDDPASTVQLINGGALATSSTQKRRWVQDGAAWHHIINPTTGLSAEPHLKTATVIAESAVAANALSTAAIVWGQEAYPRLTEYATPTRLITTTNQELTHHWPSNPSSPSLHQQ